MADGEFSVAIFYPDGTNEYVKRFVDAREAVETAKSWTERPAALIGVIRKVIITDGGDFTNFQWEYGKGITFGKE